MVALVAVIALVTVDERVHEHERDENSRGSSDGRPAPVPCTPCVSSICQPQGGAPPATALCAAVPQRHPRRRPTTAPPPPSHNGARRRPYATRHLQQAHAPCSRSVRGPRAR